jgi:predicted Zn-ribbon and HTH transcriptional regulator
MQGVNFSYFETGYYCEPAYCDTCGIVVGRDVSKSYSKCPTCREKVKFYNESLNQPYKEQEPSTLSSNYLEEKELWHCPRCKQETLKFESMGCWN